MPVREKKSDLMSFLLVQLSEDQEPTIYSRSMNGLSRRSVSTIRLVDVSTGGSEESVYSLVDGDDVDSIVDDGIPENDTSDASYRIVSMNSVLACSLRVFFITHRT